MFNLRHDAKIFATYLATGLMVALSDSPKGGRSTAWVDPIDPLTAREAEKLALPKKEDCFALLWTPSVSLAQCHSYASNDLQLKADIGILKVAFATTERALNALVLDESKTTWESAITAMYDLGKLMSVFVENCEASFPEAKQRSLNPKTQMLCWIGEDAGLTRLLRKDLSILKRAEVSKQELEQITLTAGRIIARTCAMRADGMNTVTMAAGSFRGAIFRDEVLLFDRYICEYNDVIPNGTFPLSKSRTNN